MKVPLLRAFPGVVTCAALVALVASSSVAAPVDHMVRQGADLVVQEIIVRSEGTAEFHEVRIGVRVRNRGGTNAGPTMTALVYSSDVGGGAMVLAQSTPAIAGGAHHDVEFLIEGIGGSFAGMLLAVADAPVAGHNYGQVREGSVILTSRVLAPAFDINNTFGVIFTTAGRRLPIRFQNPLVN